jgi:hypothetical protein
MLLEISIRSRIRLFKIIQVSEVIIYCFTTHYQLCYGNQTGWLLPPAKNFTLGIVKTCFTLLSLNQFFC